MILLRRFTALLLLSLLAFGMFNASMLVANYQLNKQAITEAFCVNKEKPVLKCEGKCHLTKKLKKTENKTTTDPAPDQLRVINFVFLVPTEKIALFGVEPLKNTWSITSESPLDGGLNAVFRPPVS